MKRRLQFSITTLLAVVAVCAIVAHWYATRYRITVAEQQLHAARVGLEWGGADDRDVYEASVKLLQARQRAPFCNRSDACTEHCELMTNLEELRRSLPATSTVGGSEEAYNDWVRACNEKADKIHAWVEEAQRWLDEA
jgi:hypothetical protein